MIITLRRALIPLLAGGFCACAHEPYKAPETRWLSAPPSLDVFNISRQQENTFDLGKFLVIETNDVYVPAGYASFLIDGELVLVADEAKKDYFVKFLQAAYPNIMSGPTAFPGSAGVGVPDFDTVDAYVSGLKDGDALSKASWCKEHPDKPYPFPQKDYEALRADLLKKLEGRDALILRSINAKKK